MICGPRQWMHMIHSVELRLTLKQNQTLFTPMESMFKLSKSLPIPYVVQYVPFTIHNIIKYIKKISGAALVYFKV